MLQLSFTVFIKLVFFSSDVYNCVFSWSYIVYLVSFVLYHSIAIVIDISSHVVSAERKKKKADQYMKQNKHNHLYRCVSFF